MGSSSKKTNKTKLATSTFKDYCTGLKMYELPVLIKGMIEEYKIDADCDHILSILQSNEIHSISILKRVLDREYPISDLPLIFIDMLKFHFDIKYKTKFPQSKYDQINQLSPLLLEKLKPLYINSQNIGLISKKHWKKHLKIKAGHKVELEDLINGLSETTTSHLDSSLRSLNINFDKRVNRGNVSYDRWCPHKGADLINAPIVDGNLVCPKHGWKFDLKNGGKCHKHNVTINALEW